MVAPNIKGVPIPIPARAEAEARFSDNQHKSCQGRQDREPFLLRLIDCLSYRSRAVSALLI
ncbi:hypothetical protein ACLOJK_026542 [Asimina triloba]